MGFTLWEAGHAIKEEDVPDFLAFVPRLAADGYPYLAEHAEQHIAGIGRDEEDEFEFGLRLIVDGLKRMRTAR